MGNNRKNNHRASTRPKPKDRYQKEQYIRQLSRLDSEGNTNEFDRDTLVNNFGTGVEVDHDGRHRITPPRNEDHVSGRYSKLSFGILVTIIIAVSSAIITGVYKFGNLEGRVEENINKTSDLNKNLADISNRIALIGEKIAILEERGKYSEENSFSVKNLKNQYDEMQKLLHLAEKQALENERTFQAINKKISEIEFKINQESLKK